MGVIMKMVILSVVAVLVLMLSSAWASVDLIGGPAATKWLTADAISEWSVGSGSPVYRGSSVLMEGAGGAATWAAAAVAVGSAAYAATAMLNAHYGWTNSTGNPCEGIEALCSWASGSGFTRSVGSWFKPGPSGPGSSDPTCDAHLDSSTFFGDVREVGNTTTGISGCDSRKGAYCSWSGSFTSIDDGYWRADKAVCGSGAGANVGKIYLCISPKSVCAGTTIQQNGDPVATNTAEMGQKLAADIASSDSTTSAAGRAAVESADAKLAADLATYGKPSSNTASTTAGGNPLQQGSGQSSPGVAASSGVGSTVYNIVNNVYNNSINNSTVNNQLNPDTQAEKDYSWIDILVAKFRKLFGLDEPMEDITQTGIQADENSNVIPPGEVDQKRSDEVQATRTILGRIYDATLGLRSRILTQVNTLVPSGSGVCSVPVDCFGTTYHVGVCGIDFTVVRVILLVLAGIGSALILMRT